MISAWLPSYSDAGFWGCAVSIKLTRRSCRQARRNSLNVKGANERNSTLPTGMENVGAPSMNSSVDPAAMTGKYGICSKKYLSDCSAEGTAWISSKNKIGGFSIGRRDRPVSRSNADKMPIKCPSSKAFRTNVWFSFRLISTNSIFERRANSRTHVDLPVCRAPRFMRGLRFARFNQACKSTSAWRPTYWSFIEKHPLAKFHTKWYKNVPILSPFSLFFINGRYQKRFPLASRRSNEPGRLSCSRWTGV